MTSDPNDQQQPPASPPAHTGIPPLHRAAQLGDVQLIRRLVKTGGADVNEVANIACSGYWCELNRTPLMAAAGSSEGASVETLRVLLELGADPTIVINGESAASAACEIDGWQEPSPNDSASRVRLLIDAGSPLPDEPLTVSRILYRVANSGNADLLKLLIDHWHGGDSPRLNEEDWLHALDGCESYEIPLFCAAESGSVECVKLLLAAGADIKKRSHSAETAMYCAKNLEMMRLLMDLGLPIEDRNEYGWTPLTNAVVGGIQDGGLERIKALIAAGADVNATHDHGYTVFMSAVGCMERNVEVMRLLIEAGADPHAVSDYGYNAFHAAVDVDAADDNVEQVVWETFSYLKDLGVDIQHRNKAGHTPLARAIERGYPREVRALRELGADPNAVSPLPHWGANRPDEPENLPLIFHASIGHGIDNDEKVEDLLKAGADPLATDAEGYTALQRIISKLCQKDKASDDEQMDATYRKFFEGLESLRLAHEIEIARPAQHRESFITQFRPIIQQYVEHFAKRIPVDRTYETGIGAGVAEGLADKLRNREIDAIVWLAVYEWWAQI